MAQDDLSGPPQASGGFFKGLFGVIGPRIEQMQDDAHEKKKAETEMYRSAAVRAAQIIQDGVDPSTGQPLSPEARQRYQTQYESAWGEYTKRTKQSKPAAELLKRVGGVLQHVVGGGGKGGQQAQDGGQPASTAPQSAPGVPAPPASAQQASPAPAPAPAGTPAVRTPGFNSSPGAEAALERTTGTKAYQPASTFAGPDSSTVAMAMGESPYEKSQRGIREKDAEYRNKIKAEQETRQNEIIQFRDDLKKAFPQMSDAEVQKAVETKIGVVPKPHMVTKFVRDPQSSTGYSYASYDAVSGEVYSMQRDAPPQRGLIPYETVTEDQYGNRTVSRREPVLPAPPSATGPSGKPSSGTPATGAPASTAKPTARRGTAASAPTAPGAAPALDNSGHIPSGAANPQVIEAANQLLDGTDKDKLPAKAREAAAALARQYGWEQGKFTPKEQVMLREASTFLDQMSNSPSLTVLDSDFLSQLPMMAQSQDPSKESIFRKSLDKLASRNLTPQQAEFMRLYRQVVGTISGMSQLVRSGRATEATINRLISELPNPYNTKNSADARARLARLKQELEVAQSKGTFTGAGAGGAVSKPGVPPPPSAKPKGPIVVTPEDMKQAGSGAQ